VGQDAQRVAEAVVLGAPDLTVALNDDADVVDRTLRCAARAIAGSVPGAVHVGGALLSRGALDVRALGDPVAEELDALQTAVGEGPCLEAVRSGETVEVPDLAVDARWSRVADAAARYGVVGALALVLRAHDGVLGVLTLYTRSALDTPGRALAEALAGQATVALYGALRVAGLARAVSSRDVIGQAKGILMQRDGVDGDAAFTMLVEASQATNIKLVDVAHWLVAQTRTAAAPEVPDRAVPAVPTDPAGAPD
jgi:hypothetical protein